MPPTGGPGPLYVELAGLPGAGKSAVRAALIPVLTASGYRCGVQSSMGGRVHGPDGPVDLAGRSWKRRGLVAKSTGYITLLFRLRRIAWPALRLASSSPASLRDAFRATRSLLLHVRKVWNAVEIAESGQSDLIIFDQGVLPYLRELLAASGSTGSASVASLLRPTLDALSSSRFTVIALTADVDTLASRLATRPRQLGAYDALAGEAAVSVLRTHSEAFDRLIEQLRAEMGESVIELDATAPIEATVDRCVDAVMGLIRERSAPTTPT